MNIKNFIAVLVLCCTPPISHMYPYTKGAGRNPNKL
jgi:hypothetical protein